MITESELKTIMNMPQEYPVCKETVVGFNNYIQESYKLYKELVALHGQKFSIKVEDATHNLKISIKNLQESQMIDYSFSYQQFVQGYSPTSMQFAIRYINPFDNRDIYFFETHFEKSIHTKIVCEAYKHFVVNILQEIIDRYKTKHNIELKTWMDLSKSYNPYVICNATLSLRIKFRGYNLFVLFFHRTKFKNKYCLNH